MAGFMRVGLSPLWGLFFLHHQPTAYAVSCILTPLRG
jgi:hypothetical protein